MQNDPLRNRGEEFLKLLFKGLFPLVFFVGGVVILISRIPGWSLILGLPIITIGTAILINTFDDIARETILPRRELTACAVCRKVTPVLPGVSKKDTICAKCLADIKKGVVRERSS